MEFSITMREFGITIQHGTQRTYQTTSCKEFQDIIGRLRFDQIPYRVNIKRYPTTRYFIQSKEH